MVEATEGKKTDPVKVIEHTIQHLYEEHTDDFKVYYSWLELQLG